MLSVASQLPHSAAHGAERFGKSTSYHAAGPHLGKTAAEALEAKEAASESPEVLIEPVSV